MNTVLDSLFQAFTQTLDKYQSLSVATDEALQNEFKSYLHFSPASLKETAIPPSCLAPAKLLSLCDN